jgi:two-component sensor histidine kinase
VAWRAWLPDRAAQWWQAVLFGAALAAAAVAVRLGLNGPLGRDLPFITFFPALIVASALGGFVGGLACLVAATAAALMLLIPPGASAGWVVGVFWIAGSLVIAVSAALSDSVRDLRQNRARLTDAQARLQTVVGELAHRNRNALFVIMAIVSQSARGVQSAAEAERIINARLEALLRAQDVVLSGDGGVARLRPLLEKALEPFELTRFAIAAGPDVALETDVAIGLGLLFHELATNALKYGALSVPEGGVRIDWRLEDGHARFTWREAGGPPVAAPARDGFGSRLVATALVPQVGRAERRFEADGLVCELLIPAPAAAATTKLPGSEFARQVRAEAES